MAVRRLNAPPPWMKPAVHAALSLPLAWLAAGWAELLWLDPASLRLSAEPVAYTHNLLGLWAVRSLLLALAVTPVNRLTGYVPIMTLRRMLGLWAFAYAAIHLLFFLALELDFSLVLLWKDALKRPFIFAGLLGFLCLLPLAITSTRAMIRRLSGRRWQKLHRLAYVAGVAAVVHFLLRIKTFQPEPYIYLAILTALLLIRFLPRRGSASRVPRPAA